MMKNIPFLVVFALFAIIQPIAGQNLTEVLNLHFAAMGQQQLASVQSIKMNGRISQLGIEVPFIQYKARPAQFRLEGSIEGITFIQTYNGTEGWVKDPFTGSGETQPASAKELNEMRLQAMIDGPLWNWESRGIRLTLEKNEKVEGIPCYKIKAVASDSSEYFYYIDSTTNYILKEQKTIRLGGKPALSETIYSEFKEITGIFFPGRIEHRINGITSDMILVDKVEINNTLDPSLFGKPQ